MLKTLIVAATTAVICCVYAPAQAVQQTHAHVRLLHAAPTVAAVTVNVDDQPTAITDAAYNSLTAWHQIPINPATMIIYQGDQQLLTADLSPAAGEWLTLALIGNPALDTLELRTLSENYQEMAGGEARLSVFHAIEGAPPVDMIHMDAALLQYINYPNGQDGFVSVDVIANTYTFQVVANPAPDNHLLELTNIHLQASYHTFIALTGTPDSPTFIQHTEDVHAAKAATHRPLLIPATTLELSGFLRLGHFASGAPEVNLIINGETSAITGVPFAHISTYVELPPGSQEFIISYGEMQLVPAFDVPIMPDSWYTVALIGALDNGTLAAQVFEEDHSTLPDNQTRIGVFQAVPGLPPVDLQTADGTSLIRLLGHPGSQGNNDGYEAVEITAGTQNLDVVSSADETEVIIDLPEVNFEANHSYLITTLRADPPYIIEKTALESEEE